MKEMFNAHKIINKYIYIYIIRKLVNNTDKTWSKSIEYHLKITRLYDLPKTYISFNNNYEKCFELLFNFYLMSLLHLSNGLTGYSKKYINWLAPYK